MKTCKVELTARGKTLAEVKIQRLIVQRDALLSLLFVIAMMPHIYILKECVGSYTFIKS